MLAQRFVFRTSIFPFDIRSLGSCLVTSTFDFFCQCQPVWRGEYCEEKVNYCANVSCLNGGVCRALVGNYRCECLGDSYSGRHCENTASRTALYGAVSRSMAYVAIVAMSGAGAFIVVMDALKYVFNIDPVRPERKRRPKQEQRKTQRKAVAVAIHYFYVHAEESALDD